MYAAVLRSLSARRGAGSTTGDGAGRSSGQPSSAPSQAAPLHSNLSGASRSQRGTGAEEVEITVVGGDAEGSGALGGGRGSDSGAGGSGSGHDDVESGRASTASADSDNPAVVVIEDVSGNIYLGVDPDKYEKQRAEQQARLAAERLANPQVHGLEDDGFMDNEDFIRFADEYQLALIDRRKKGCLFLLGMDIVYLVFIALLPYIIPYHTRPSPDTSNDSLWSPAANATDSGYATYNGTGYNYTYNGSTYFAPSGESRSMDTTFFGAIDRSIMELIFFLAIDVMGIIACIKGSPPLLTIFVLLLSVVTVLTAIRSLSPVLVFRMIIIMLALQLRASILLARPNEGQDGNGGHEPRTRTALVSAMRWLRNRRASRRQATTTTNGTATTAPPPQSAPVASTHQQHEAPIASTHRTEDTVPTTQGNTLYGDPSSSGHARIGDAEAQYRHGMAGGGWGAAI
mmetsp:Transcript_34659/g.61805  ORF Transcript_34659/g.61805 Transcript_34659/m.61805 type:complete len:457 (-) Transcript_34659:197-1567(-)